MLLVMAVDEGGESSHRGFEVEGPSSYTEPNHGDAEYKHY